MSPRALLPIFTLTALLGLAPGSALATTCGKAPRRSHTPVKASLKLQSDSVTTIAFRRATEPQQLMLHYRATGCTLPRHPRHTSYMLLPQQGVLNVPAAAVSLTKSTVDGGDWRLLFTAHPKALSPGAYGGLLQVRSPTASSSPTPISLTRSESNELVVIALGLVGGIAAMIWFVGLRLAKEAPDPKWWHYVLGFVAAAVAGVLAVETAYRAQDVWSFSENAGSALVAAFTGATTGAMVAALGVLFPDGGKGDGTDPDGAKADGTDLDGTDPAPGGR